MSGVYWGLAWTLGNQGALGLLRGVEGCFGDVRGNQGCRGWQVL